MPKRKLTKHEDDIRRGLRSPDSIPPYGKLRKSAENSPSKSPHEGIHTCSKGCSKPGCTRAMRDTIQEQDEQIEALKRDLLEKTAELRKKAQERVHDINQIGGLQEENARLKAEVDKLTFDPLSYLDDAGEWMPRHTHLAAVARLKAEVERLRNLGIKLESKIDPLLAQVERLTKAGDAMAKDLQGEFGDYPSADAWNAAKQGGQP